MKTISRYLMTLVALFAMTTGAWANIATIEFTKESVPGSWKNNFTLISPDYLPDFKPATDAEAIAWDGASKTNKTILIYGFDGEKVKSVLFNPAGGYQTRNEISSLYDFYEQVMENDYIVCYTTFAVFLNDTKTEASFDMPQYDVTATYTIKRDMTVDMTTKVGDGTDGVRFRIKKNAQSKYELVEEGANQPEVMDEIDAQNPTEVPATGYTLQLQKLADDGETWENVSDYSVGTFRYVVTGQGDYDGIVYTNTFELFEGYVVKIPANEYITFFQKEMLYVEDEDVKIYTIVSVSDDEATATATEISVTSPNMPVLVKNNSAEDKNVLLIPTTDKSPDAVFVYDGFKGTLEATQIAASDDTQNNYAFNGMQFVWVKNALDIDANKAWLEVPASNTAQARSLTIVFSSETTGVELVPAFTTEGEGEWYDLNGRKLGKKPTVKGVYILRQADGKSSKKVAVE